MRRTRAATPTRPSRRLVVAVVSAFALTPVLTAAAAPSEPAPTFYDVPGEWTFSINSTQTIDAEDGNRRRNGTEVTTWESTPTDGSSDANGSYTVDHDVTQRSYGCPPDGDTLVTTRQYGSGSGDAILFAASPEDTYTPERYPDVPEGSWTAYEPYANESYTLNYSLFDCDGDPEWRQRTAVPAGPVVLIPGTPEELAAVPVDTVITESYTYTRGSVEFPDDPVVSTFEVSLTATKVNFAEPECTITGTPGRDRLVGTVGDDVICGLGGEDVLLGGGGNDTLYGGPGQDDLIGGDGDDTLYGGPDDDALRGDAGVDILHGQEHTDLVTYFTATGGATIDLAAGTGTAPGHDEDTLVSIEGAFGTKHADQITGDGGSNHLFGGPGTDTISGLGGTDILRGTGGDDRLLGGNGGDLLFGDAGKDVLTGGATRDACYGGGGGLTAVSCEVGHDKPDAGRQAFGRIAEVAVAPSFRVGGATYWYIGDGDYLFVYGPQATQTIGSWTGTPSWEGLVCQVIRKTPAGAACSASSALQAVNKSQMQWFLWNAKKNSGCAVGIFDRGRHGVNQFQKRWKTRPASYYDYKVAIPWVTPGRVSRIKTSDSREVGRKYVNVTC